MLKLLKTNNPAVLLILLIYFLLLHFPWLYDLEMGTEEPEAPFARLVFELLDLPWWQHWMSILLIVIPILANALFVNAVSSRHKIPEEDSFYPVLFYLLINAALLFFSPSVIEYLASFFIIFSIYKVFGFYKSEASAGALFDAAFLIAIAALFYLPALFIGIWVLIAVAVLRPFSFREAMIVITGFVVPFFLSFTWYFWFEQLDYFFSDYLALQPGLPEVEFFSSWPPGKIMLAVFAVVIFFLMMRTAGATTTGNIKLRKYLNLIILLTIVSGAAYFGSGELTSSAFVLMAIPVALLFAFNFISLPHRMAEILHWVLFLGLLTVHYYNFAINY